MLPDNKKNYQLKILKLTNTLLELFQNKLEDELDLGISTDIALEPLHFNNNLTEVTINFTIEQTIPNEDILFEEVSDEDYDDINKRDKIFNQHVVSKKYFKSNANAVLKNITNMLRHLPVEIVDVETGEIGDAELKLLKAQIIN